MAIGWFLNLAAADTYMTTEQYDYLTFWFPRTDPEKTLAILHSYNRIFYNPDYNVPTYTAASVAQLDILSKANGIFAKYIIIHIQDEDRRHGIIDQGVTIADIVEEEYSEAAMGEVPIPAVVKNMLKVFNNKLYFGKTDIDRDEDESVDTNVTGY